MINTVSNLFVKVVPHWGWHNARYIYYTYCGIVCAAHMGAVLWSAVLHAVLRTAQPLQPLHSLTPDWLHTSQHN